MEAGLAVSVGAVSTVKFTGTTTGLFDACELMLMEPVYGPGVKLEKFTNPTTMLPGVFPVLPLWIASQLPPDCVVAVAV